MKEEKYVMLTSEEQREILTELRELRIARKPDTVRMDISHKVFVSFGEDEHYYRVYPTYISFSGDINFSEDTTNQLTDLYNKISNEVISVMVIRLDKAKVETENCKKELSLIKSKWWYKLFNKD